MKGTMLGNIRGHFAKVLVRQECGVAVLRKRQIEQAGRWKIRSLAGCSLLVMTKQGRIVTFRGSGLYFGLGFLGFISCQAESGRRRPIMLKLLEPASISPPSM